MVGNSSFLSTFQFPHTLRRIFQISRSQCGQGPRKLPSVYNVNFHFPPQEVPDKSPLLLTEQFQTRFVQEENLTEAHEVSRRSEKARRHELRLPGYSSRRSAMHTCTFLTCRGIE